MPRSTDHNLYEAYPAINRCIVSGELMYSRLSGETLSRTIVDTEASIRTTSVLEITQAGKKMTDEEHKVISAASKKSGISNRRFSAFWLTARSAVWS